MSCDYYNKPHYTRETYWKIHDKSTNWKSSKLSDRLHLVFPSANKDEPSSYSKDHTDHILKLLKSNASYGIPSVSLAQTGSNPNAISCYSNFIPWIIDSSASYHMISFSHLFITYSPCFGNEKLGLSMIVSHLLWEKAS